MKPKFNIEHNVFFFVINPKYLITDIFLTQNTSRLSPSQISLHKVSSTPHNTSLPSFEQCILVFLCMSSPKIRNMYMYIYILRVIMWARVGSSSHAHTKRYVYASRSNRAQRDEKPGKKTHKKRNQPNQPKYVFLLCVSVPERNV